MSAERRAYILRLLRRSHNKIILILLLIISLCLFPSSIVSAASKGKNVGYTDPGRTIRVGFYPLANGQVSYDDGTYGGYYFDYLQEIAQYTGWNYAYVKGSFDECYKMMQDGKINLMCGLNKTDERAETLDFSDESEKTQKYKLYVLTSRDDITYENYRSFDGMRVAVIKGDIQAASLDKYCDKHNIHMSFVPCNTESEFADALISGKVDAVYANNMETEPENKVVEYFAAEPLYYVSPKGTGIMNTFNDAARAISNADPDFENNLYSRYLSSKAVCSSPSFTTEELEYINAHPVIKVAYIDNWKPIEYLDRSDDTAHGISITIIERIAELSGLKVKYVPYSSNTKAEFAAVNYDVDVLSAAPFDFGWASRNGMNLSSPYTDTTIVKVKSKAQNNSTDIAVTTSMLEYNADVIPANSRLHFYETTTDCLDAVKNRKAGVTYLNYLTASYFLKSTKYSSLMADNYNESDLSMCFAISERKDQRLLSILNKSLLCMSDQYKKSIVYNSTVNTSDTALQIMLYSHPVGFITLIAIMFVVFSLLMFYISIIRKKETEKIKYISEHDPLTGIYNRGTSRSMIDHSLEENRKHPPEINPMRALLIIDLDHFKQINDTYGHPEGDRLLQRVAAIIPECLRPNDIYGRLGGDEFVIYLKNIPDIRNIELIAGRLCTRINSLSDENPKWKSVSSSIGISYDDTSESDAEELYLHADLALYEAKKKGRNRYMLYDESISGLELDPDSDTQF